MLIARTSAECQLYMALHACDCGAVALDPAGHQLERREAGMVAVYAGTCAGCGAARSFELVLHDETPPSPPSFGCASPSAIIDAGEFLAIADAEGAQVPADQDLNAAARQPVLENGGPSSGSAAPRTPGTRPRRAPPIADRRPPCRPG